MGCLFLSVWVQQSSSECVNRVHTRMYEPCTEIAGGGAAAHAAEVGKIVFHKGPFGMVMHITRTCFVKILKITACQRIRNLRILSDSLFVRGTKGLTDSSRVTEISSDCTRTISPAVHSQADVFSCQEGERMPRRLHMT